jgi:hypothetical protein
MPGHEMFRDAHRRLNDFLRANGFLLVAAQVFVVAFPLFEGLVRTQLAERQQHIPALAWGLGYAGYVLVALFVTFGLYRVQEYLQAVSLDEMEQTQLKYEKQLDKAESKIDAWRGEFEAENSRSAAVLGALTSLQELLCRVGTDGPTDEHVQRLLVPLTADRADALDFRSEDMHNFVVYKFNDERRKLEVFYRLCDDRIETHNRSWGKGQGHVGIAFAQEKAIISGDVADAEEFIDRVSYQTDKEYYSSFISVPIPDVEEDAEEPVGVFVITSSRAGQFGDEHKIVADSFALLLSTLFCAHKITGERETNE